MQGTITVLYTFKSEVAEELWHIAQRIRPLSPRFGHWPWSNHFSALSKTRCLGQFPSNRWPPSYKLQLYEIYTSAEKEVLIVSAPTQIPAVSAITSGTLYPHGLFAYQMLKNHLLSKMTCFHICNAFVSSCSRFWAVCSVLAQRDYVDANPWEVIIKGKQHRLTITLPQSRRQLPKSSTTCS